MYKNFITELVTVLVYNFSLRNTTFYACHCYRMKMLVFDYGFLLFYSYILIFI